MLLLSLFMTGNFNVGTTLKLDIQNWNESVCLEKKYETIQSFMSLSYCIGRPTKPSQGPNDDPVYIQNAAAMIKALHQAGDAITESHDLTIAPDWNEFFLKVDEHLSGIEQLNFEKFYSDRAKPYEVWEKIQQNYLRLSMK